MCRLPDKAGASSNGVAANGFPDSNQRRGVGQGLGVGGGRKMRRVWAKWQKSPSSWRVSYLISRQKISKAFLIPFLFSC